MKDVSVELSTLKPVGMMYEIFVLEASSTITPYGAPKPIVVVTPDAVTVKVVPERLPPVIVGLVIEIDAVMVPACIEPAYTPEIWVGPMRPTLMVDASIEPICEATMVPLMIEAAMVPVICEAVIVPLK